MASPRPTTGKLTRRLAFASAIALLGGGAAGPDYVRPKLDVGQHYKEAQGWTKASPAAVSLREDWWRMYGDPVLDGLMRTLRQANLSVAQAQAQYLQAQAALKGVRRSEEHTSELQSLMRTSYAVFCLKKNKKKTTQ